MFFRMKKGCLHLGRTSQEIHSLQKLMYRHDYMNSHITRHQFKKLPKAMKALEESKGQATWPLSLHLLTLNCCFPLSLNAQNNVCSMRIKTY